MAGTSADDERVPGTTPRLRRRFPGGGAFSRWVSLVVLLACLVSLVVQILRTVPLGPARPVGAPITATRSSATDSGTCVTLTSIGRIVGTAQRHPLGPPTWTRVGLAGFHVEETFAAACRPGAAPVKVDGLQLYERWTHDGDRVRLEGNDLLDRTGDDAAVTEDGRVGVRIGFGFGPGYGFPGPVFGIGPGIGRTRDRAQEDEARRPRWIQVQDAADRVDRSRWGISWAAGTRPVLGTFRTDRMCLVQGLQVGTVRRGSEMAPAVTMPPFCLPAPS